MAKLILKFKTNYNFKIFTDRLQGSHSKNLRDRFQRRRRLPAGPHYDFFEKFGRIIFGNRKRKNIVEIHRGSSKENTRMASKEKVLP